MIKNTNRFDRSQLAPPIRRAKQIFDQNKETNRLSTGYLFYASDPGDYGEKQFNGNANSNVNLAIGIFPELQFFTTS